MFYKKRKNTRESFLRNKTESDALSISKIEHRKAVSLRQNCDTFLSGDDSLRKEKKMSYQNSAHARIRQYSLPQLSTGKCWYITFNAFDPEIGKMRRKRLRVSPKIKKTADRRRYAQDVMQRLTEQLQNGWNPWICYQSPDTFTTWADACDNYRSTLGRLKADGCLKEKTIYGYLRMLDAFCSWAKDEKLHYTFQFDRRLLSRFIDWIWLDQGRSIRTRNNYVTWLKIFSKWMLSKEYIELDAADGLQLFGGKAQSGKNRTIIPAEAMQRLRTYCQEQNPHFLLACYVLYYCLIRPNEMSYIQLKHISVERGTIYIPDYSSKNGKGATVTLPDQVIRLMIQLRIFEQPDTYYLFSAKCMPGRERHTAKQFSDFWDHHIRKDLKFPMEWKFYSLKDTGITDLIKDNTDLLSVRNQARHHSLLMTDIYTPHDIAQANDIIRHRSGIF